MSDLTVNLVQTALEWELPAGNKAHLEHIFSDMTQADLVVLPEMFTTGFSMEPWRLAETMTGETVIWMTDQARKLGAVLAGSLIMEDDGKYYNRLVLAYPDGQLVHYDKRHLFSMAGEDTHYECGTERVVAEIKGWRVNLQVCYDLRFPVFARNRGDYDVLLYTANWPEPRRETWMTLLRARAMENQAYVLGVNRVGVDGNNLPYSGDSLIVDSRGDVMAQLEPGKAGVLTATLSREAQQAYKEKFPIWSDADSFTLQE